MRDDNSLDDPETPFDPIDIDRVADSVVEQIEDLLVSGALRSGQKLPPERELAEAMQVSRPKLREAMRRLEADGLIEIRRSDGIFVRELTGPVLAPPLLGLCARNTGAFLDFLEFRREQECFAAMLAAERATAEDRIAITAAMEAMEGESPGDVPGTMARFDLAFHMAIIEAAHNAILLHVMRSIYDLMSRGIFAKRDVLYRSAETRARLLEQHRAIAGAIVAGEADAAGAASEGHLDYVATSFAAAEDAESRSRIARKRLASSRMQRARLRPRSV